MDSVTITLPDKSTKEYSSGISSYEIANEIGTRLAQDSIAVKVNYELHDINSNITEDSMLEFVTINSGWSFERSNIFGKLRFSRLLTARRFEKSRVRTVL